MWPDDWVYRQNLYITRQPHCAACVPAVYESEQASAAAEGVAKELAVATEYSLTVRNERARDASIRLLARLQILGNPGRQKRVWVGEVRRSFGRKRRDTYELAGRVWPVGEFWWRTKRWNSTVHDPLASLHLTGIHPSGILMPLDFWLHEVDDQPPSGYPALDWSVEPSGRGPSYNPLDAVIAEDQTGEPYTRSVMPDLSVHSRVARDRSTPDEYKVLDGVRPWPHVKAALTVVVRSATGDSAC